MRPSIRKLALLAVAGSILVPLVPAHAQDYPAKPIEIVTQGSIGGGSDVAIRQLAEAAADLVPQPLVVVNKPGAGGQNLENYVKRAKPDGYTLVMTSSINLFWYYAGSLSMNINTDLKPIIRFQVEPNLVVVRADAPWKSMQELIAAAKADEVTFGGLPVGSAEHMFFTKLAHDNEFKLSFVAYEGGGEAIPSLLGGHIDATMLQNSEASQYIKSGDFRALGVASTERVIDIEGLNDVPTLKEQGVDFVFEQWRGIHTFADVPDSTVEYLYDKFAKATEKESWRKWLKETGQVGSVMGPADFKTFTVAQDKLVDELSAAVGTNKRR
jgi:putative tricarboxylic transport membrane protein